jgi:hypothetical protein
LNGNFKFVSQNFDHASDPSFNPIVIFTRRHHFEVPSIVGMPKIVISERCQKSKVVFPGDSQQQPTQFERFVGITVSQVVFTQRVENPLVHFPRHVVQDDERFFLVDD